MGVETDYIAANDDQIDEIWESLSPATDFKGVYGKGTDPVSLSMLHFCITGDNYDPDKISEFNPLRIMNDGERLLMKVPSSIRESINTITKGNIDDVLSKWSQTEEYILTGWDDGIATEFLLELSDYSIQNSDKTLYMWMCV